MDYSGYPGYPGYPVHPEKKSNAGVIAVVLALVLLVLIVIVYAVAKLGAPRRSEIVYDPNSGQAIIIHVVPETGEIREVPTDTDPDSGEPLYNCRCEKRTGCAETPYYTSVENIPESEMRSDYRPCAPSTSGWFCTTTVEESSYCKINNLSEQQF